MIRAFFLLLMLAVTACGDDLREVKDTRYVFGTLVEFTVRARDETAARDAITAVGHEFQRMHRDWHAWKPGALTDLNRAFAEGRTVEVDGFLLPLLRQAKEYRTLSEGLFDPAIGKLIGAWGYHADELPKGSVPDAELIAGLVAGAPSMDDVVIEGNRVHSTNPLVHLDFGGFGKGVALDRAMAMLKERGIADAIVNAGGDLNTIGNAGERPWRVAIRDPKKRGAVVAWLELGDGENLYTSGDYERFRTDDGVRWGHIVDPRTGWPTRNFVSVSVVHRNGALADAAATALTVAGPEDWHRMAKKMGVRFAFLLDEKDRAYANPGMLERLRFEGGTPEDLVVSPAL